MDVDILAMTLDTFVVVAWKGKREALSMCDKGKQNIITVRNIPEGLRFGSIL
jgi:hypothetical protein